MWSLRPAHHPSEIYMNSKKAESHFNTARKYTSNSAEHKSPPGWMYIKDFFSVRHIMWNCITCIFGCT